MLAWTWASVARREFRALVRSGLELRFANSTIDDLFQRQLDRGHAGSVTLADLQTALNTIRADGLVAHAEEERIWVSGFRAATPACRRAAALPHPARRTAAHVWLQQ